MSNVLVHLSTLDANALIDLSVFCANDLIYVIILLALIFCHISTFWAFLVYFNTIPEGRDFLFRVRILSTNLPRHGIRLFAELINN